MSLRAIVAALGGDLYQGGCRANVPAPGHSAEDRSISLLLSEGRVILHGFGGVDWRAARDHLLTLGLIDPEGRPTAAGRAPQGAPLRPDRIERVATARRLWDETTAVSGTLSQRHLLSRGVRLDPAGLQALGHHPGAPVSVFRPQWPRRPALIARISDPSGALTAVELVYLEPNGLRADRLRVPRKTVGRVPPASAVRLMPAAHTLLVGEGVMTVLSASAWFSLPAWALLSARNLSTWVAPETVRRVVIAGDRGETGETAAAALRNRLVRQGLAAVIALPPAGADDWNAALGGGGRRKGGEGRRGDGDRPRRPAGDAS